MPSQLAATLSSDCAEFEIVSKSSPIVFARMTFCQDLWKISTRPVQNALCSRYAFELFRNVDVSYDRTCDKLWEKGNIGGKVKEVLLTSYFALINVDNVGKGLKAVE